jgi:glucoamylase
MSEPMTTSAAPRPPLIDPNAPIRALSTPRAPANDGHTSIAVGGADLQTIAQHMYALMLRNIASDGFPFTDSTHTLVSRPGCVLAAPSYPANAPGISQDYVFNWVRDAAITVLEVTAAIAGTPGAPVQPLADYVSFARTCYNNAVPTKGHACFTVVGDSRPWTEQNDGPGIQSVALLAAYPLLDAASQDTAKALITDNVNFLLQVYQDQTTNLWEEHSGYSFFARSVQLRCLREIAANDIGLAVPAGVDAAIGWLESALQIHWNGSYYATMIGGQTPGDPAQSTVPYGYDPNIDIVQACIYGAVPCTDTKMLATAALLRSAWADPSSDRLYPINITDAANGLGPMFGRYPGDFYDGAAGSVGGHPWALCTANFAELHYRLAAEVAKSGVIPLDEHSEPFFAQLGITSGSTAENAASTLVAAGDAMMFAVLSHSDHLELSEQYDGTSGYERSVRDLTWSYAAFLSAVRAKTGVAPRA